MANHAGDAQAALGQHAVLAVVAAVKVGVGHDGAARDLVEGNVFRRQVGGAGHHHRVTHAFGVLQGPAQGLHAAQAAAHDGGQGLDAQRIEQAGLGIDPVLHRHHREIRAVHLVRVRVELHGAGGAEAGAQVVDANHKKPVGVHRLARAYHGVPPAF